MWAGIISGTRRTFFFCFSSFHFLSSIFSDVHRARAGGDEQREGWRRCWTNSLLSGLASVCEWHTPCSREGQRMGFKNCLFQTLPTLMRERIESASHPAGSISSIQDLMARCLLKWANHNTQNEWRKCPVEYVPCCATRAGLCWAGHAASRLVSSLPLKFSFFRLKEWRTVIILARFLYDLQYDTVHWVHHWLMFNQEVKGYTEQYFRGNDIRLI